MDDGGGIKGKIVNCMIVLCTATASNNIIYPLVMCYIWFCFVWVWVGFLNFRFVFVFFLYIFYKTFKNSCGKKLGVNLNYLCNFI